MLEEEILHNNRILARAKAEEKKYQKRILQIYDWSEPEDVLEYKRQKRIKLFVDRMERFAPNFICPECGIFKVKRKEWVLGTNKVVCRMCYITSFRKQHGRIISREVEQKWEGLFRRQCFYTIDMKKVKKVLKEKGSNLKEFYYKSGYESWDFDKIISPFIYRDIIQVLGRDDVFPCVINKYELNGSLLKERRTISSHRFAKECEWSQSWQMRLEQGTMLVSQDTRDRIIECMNT